MIDTRNCEKYGYSRLQRKKELDEKKKTSNKFASLEVMGKYSDFPIVEVRIELPVYRLANGRTKTLQREYLAKHPEQPADLFTKDHDEFAAQFAQNEILEKLVKDEDLLSEFGTNNVQQTEPIIVTHDGIVINGNRRLCAWRKLFYGDPVKYKHFQTIRVLVLDECDEQALIDLEEQLQTQKTMKADYKWHAIAQMGIEEQSKHPGKEGSIAGKLGLKSSQELKLLIEAYNYADQYLQSRGRKDMWSDVDGDRYAFEAMVKTRKKINGQELKEFYEALAFQHIESGSAEGRLYTVLQEIGENIEYVYAEHKKQLEAEKEKEKELTSEKPEEKQPESKPAPKQDDSDLLSGDDDDDSSTESETEKEEVFEVIEHVKNISAEQVQKSTKNAVEMAKQIKKDKENEDYLLNQIVKAETLLHSAIDNGLSGDAATEGVATHLDSIEGKIEQIRKWLNKQ